MTNEQPEPQTPIADAPQGPEPYRPPSHAAATDAKPRDRKKVALIAGLAGLSLAGALAEIGSLYVLPFYHNRGIGKKMVDYACLMAKERGATQIVALSTQSFGFFTNTCGFEEADKSALPETRLKVYEENGRNAKVLTKSLG